MSADSEPQLLGHPAPLSQKSRLSHPTSLTSAATTTTLQPFNLLSRVFPLLTRIPRPLSHPPLRTMSEQLFVRTKPPPLLVPSTSTQQLKLAAQAQFDPSASTDAAYVLHVVALPNQGGFLFAGSDDSLRAFSPALEPLAVLPSTQKGITSLVSGAGEGSTAVFSTARDGTVVGWDTRDLSREAFKLKGEQPRRHHSSPARSRVR